VEMLSFVWSCAACCVFEGAIAASWAKLTNYADSSCKTETAGSPDSNYPMLLETCVLSYRGTQDKTKWVYTKASCNATDLVRTGYQDSDCTKKASDTSLDLTDSLPCTGNRRSLITCGVQHDVVLAKAFLLGANPDPSLCTDAYQVSVSAFAIGMCYAKQGSEVLGYKSVCDNQRVVTTMYNDSLTCSGKGTEFFQFGTTCAETWNKNSYMALNSGCGGIDQTSAQEQQASSCTKSAGITIVMFAMCCASFWVHP